MSEHLAAAAVSEKEWLGSEPAEVAQGWARVARLDWAGLLMRTFKVDVFHVRAV